MNIYALKTVLVWKLTGYFPPETLTRDIKGRQYGT